MGEARRKRAAMAVDGDNGEEFESVDALGQKIMVRRTSATPSDVLQAAVTAITTGAPVNVPCAGCRACCWHPRVDVYPDRENLDGLEYEPFEGGYRLRKRSDGACVHLGEHGCTVYDRRPRSCRLFDCRYLTLLGRAEEFDSGHVAPSWALTSRTDTDVAIITATNMVGYAQVVSGERWEPEAVALRIHELIPDILKMVPFVRRMSREEQDAAYEAASAHLRSAAPRLRALADAMAKRTR